jgi:hypothetical protein
MKMCARKVASKFTSDAPANSRMHAARENRRGYARRYAKRLVGINTKTSRHRTLATKS